MTAPAATGGKYTTGGLAARRFPLIPRPKPPCRPLTQRLDRAARLASQAEADDADAPLRAADACNLAALIASDCAMPDLARDMCWQQFEAYLASGSGPYSEPAAKLALQPLVNLARLRIRAGDGNGGYQVLQSLHDAARSSRGQAVIDGRAVSLAALIAPGSTRETITEWLWATLLSDGLRGLCKAGRWSDALRHAQQHDGIGQRLLDGRQIATLARAAAGEQEEAGKTLQQANVSEPWEHVVAGCLRTLVQAGDGPAPADASADMTGAYLAFSDPGRVMFTACLGLTVTELAVPGDGRHAAIGKVARIATGSRDAYIAREILTSPVAALLGQETLTELNGIVRQSGLGQPLTAAQTRQLTGSLRAAAALLAARL